MTLPDEETIARLIRSHCHSGIHGCAIGAPAARAVHAEIEAALDSDAARTGQDAGVNDD